MLNGLDLFSGIGGLARALDPWVRTVAYCENDRYAQAVLLSRMQRRELCRAPIWPDVRTLQLGRVDISLPVDLIAGGFPCQDISVAGNGAGLGGSRSGLFFEIIRLVREFRPRFIFLENVPAITVRGLDRVLLELSALGYDCRWTIVSAAEVGAPHLRERWFLLAHSIGARLRNPEQPQGRRIEAVPSANGERGPMAYAARSRDGQLSARSWREGEGAADAHRSGQKMADASSIGSGARAWRGQESGRAPEDTFANDWWAIEPHVGRVAHGVPQRVDRLRGLGNAVVPLQARIAFQRLIGIEGGY